MQTLVERGCGLDVHQATVVACLLIVRKDGRVQKQMRTFATFKIYPEAKLDEKSTTEATKSPVNKGMDVKVYVTDDAFEKVRAFYASLYHETRGGNPPRAPNGPEIHWALFAIDDAKNLWTSRNWVKVQRPYIGNRPGELLPNLNDVRDENVIEVVQKR